MAFISLRRKNKGDQGKETYAVKKDQQHTEQKRKKTRKRKERKKIQLKPVTYIC